MGDMSGGGVLLTFPQETNGFRDLSVVVTTVMNLLPLQNILSVAFLVSKGSWGTGVALESDCASYPSDLRRAVWGFSGRLCLRL